MSIFAPTTPSGPSTLFGLSTVSGPSTLFGPSTVSGPSTLFAPSTHWTPSADDLQRFTAPQCTTPCPPPCSPDDNAPPPEMPDAVKAHGLKGFPCYYGFEFPDAAAAAYNQAHAIERPENEDFGAWMAWSKRAAMNEHARELGIRFSAHLALHSVVSSGTPGACQEDVVHFAFMISGRFVGLQCLTTRKIQQFMRILGIPGEPYWIMA